MNLIKANINSFTFDMDVATTEQQPSVIIRILYAGGNLRVMLADGRTIVCNLYEKPCRNIIGGSTNLELIGLQIEPDGTIFCLIKNDVVIKFNVISNKRSVAEGVERDKYIRILSGKAIGDEGLLSTQSSHVLSNMCVRRARYADGNLYVRFIAGSQSLGLCSDIYKNTITGTMPGLIGICLDGMVIRHLNTDGKVVDGNILSVERLLLTGEEYEKYFDMLIE